MNLKYEKLEMKSYLMDGDRSRKISNLIFKARGQNLDIKIQQKWKYEDKLCSGCIKNEESAEEILACDEFGKNYKNLKYSDFFSDSVSEQISVAKVLERKLKRRKDIRD